MIENDKNKIEKDNSRTERDNKIEKNKMIEKNKSLNVKLKNKNNYKFSNLFIYLRRNN